MVSKTQAAYVSYLERTLKRTKQQLREHIASEKDKEQIIEELLNVKCDCNKA